MKFNSAEVEEHLNDLAMQVSEGEADAMETYGIIQTLRKTLESIEKGIKAEAIESALGHSADKGEVSYKGFKFKFAQGRRMFKFDHIPSWKKANETLKEIEELAKVASEKGSGQYLDEETGEVIEIEPAIVSYAAASLSVSKI